MELKTAAETHILVVEDHSDILANIVDYLSSEGYRIDCASHGLTALHLISENFYDLIILDLMLPGMDGLSVCTEIRKSINAGSSVIMLTARDALEDRLEGFERGADDYLTKPFALPELAARIKALLRRSQTVLTHSLMVEDLTYNLDTFEVHRAGRPLQIGPIGLQILEVLMRKSPAVVRRHELERCIWGDSPPDSDSLRSHIHALRQQIDGSTHPPLLHTIHRIGYQLGSA
jgi:DNA-binding response OmpR family regulator